MNWIAISLFAVSGCALLGLPRRWALVAFMAGTCYLFTVPVVELGVFSFNVLRFLVTIGCLRVIVRGERLAGGFNRLDLLMLLWAIWLGVSSLFHEEPTSDLVTKAGNAYDACGIYFLARIFCVSLEDVITLFRATAVVLVPVAAGMLYEQMAEQNLFALVGRAWEVPVVRDGMIRSVGPFRHPILAGTVGAVTLPLMIALWRNHHKTAWMGAIACLSIVVSSGSSGPLVSAGAALVALCLWRYRNWMRLFRWSTVAGYVMLELAMNAPAYYIVMHLDVTGSSTGWHRAKLMESSLAHLNEWWLAGTDYTRHWMPAGVPWSPNHADITNHYLKMGVMGGLPLMFLFIAVLATAFSYVGRAARYTGDQGVRSPFIAWTIGSALFAAAVTSMSISYFDQSILFLYLPVAAISSLTSSSAGRRRRPTELAPRYQAEDKRRRYCRAQCSLGRPS